MLSEIQIILQSPTMISSCATATVISMALSVFLYNGYYNKIWRAIAVMAGLVLSITVLIKGLDDVGLINFELMMCALMFSLFSCIFGFWLGVFIYNREVKRAQKKYKTSCHINDCEVLTKQEGRLVI